LLLLHIYIYIYVVVLHRSKSSLVVSPRLCHQARIFFQHLVQTLTRHTMFEFETLGDDVQLMLTLATEVLAPFFDEKFRKENVARKPSNAVGKGPHRRGVEILVFWLDFFLYEV